MQDLSFLIGKPLEFCENYLKENNILCDIKVYNGKKMGITDTKLVINYRFSKGRVLLYVSDFLLKIED